MPTKSDYLQSLRQNLPYRELRVLVEAFCEVLPGFNCEVVGTMPIERLAAISAALHVLIELSPHDGDGLALWGFFLKRKEGLLECPLIYLNTAHHPLAVSLAFCHELAHHVSSELTNSDARVRFLENADYASHLSNPQELAADSIVSIAVYPEALARKIFAKPWKWRFVGEAKDMTDEALAEVRRHLNKAYGYELMEQMMPNLRSHYWASMIHHAKLRWALLAVHDL